MPKKNKSQRESGACIKPNHATSQPQLYPNAKSSPLQNLSKNRANLAKLTRYDYDAEHSKSVHKAACMAHAKTTFSAYEKRKQTPDERKHFDALFGRGRTYLMSMPASDLKLRNKFGEFLIDQAQELFFQISSAPNMVAYHVTIFDDQFLMNERTIVAEVQKFRDKVQSAIRNYTNLDGVFMIELAPILNFPKGKGGKYYSLHAHGLCWGPKGSDPQSGLNRARGFRSELTKIPILIQEIAELEGSFTKVARYICKPPYQGKTVDYEKLAAGKKCLNTVSKSLKKVHHFRLGEFFAKLPIDYLCFGCSRGTAVRESVMRRLWEWQKSRNGTSFQPTETVAELFENVFKKNPKLHNYEPMKVNYIRRDKLRT